MATKKLAHLLGLSTPAQPHVVGTIRVIAALVAFTLAGQPAHATQHWQLTFSYDSTSLAVVEAGRIPSMPKLVRTPGLAGAPLKIAYDLDWLDDEGKIIISTQVQTPLGVRSALAEGEPCQVVIPERGMFVIRLEGPEAGRQPSAVRLAQTGISGSAADRFAAPRALKPGSFVLPIMSFSDGSLRRDGPLSVTKIWDTGPDDNRLVIVVMGDGYTMANLIAGDFAADAAGLVVAFQGKAPWDIFFDGVNVYRIDIESNEEGADHDPYGTYVDTYLNSSFWIAGIERLLALDGVGLSRAFAAANDLVGVGVWDDIFVLVNSTKYGGSGGTIAVSSVHSAASEIILHEYGHSFAGLADEYGGTSGPPGNDYEPNVDFDYSGPDLKWIDWVEPGTPLPTPNSPSYSGVVGAFEGAKYTNTGIYRPWYNCLMRSLGVEFGPICKEVHALEYLGIVSLADQVSPPPGTSHFLTETGQLFAIDPLSINGIVFEWRLEGNAIPGASGPELLLTGDDLDDLGLVSATLEVELAFPTPLILGMDVQETYSWTVETYCDCGTWGDVTDDAAVNPQDVTYMVQYVFMTNDIRVQPPKCPLEAGDVNCDGHVNPQDVTYYVQYVFMTNNMFCDDPCAP